MIDLAALTSLRAVATHGSVIAAADVLGYTPSAVSQQVKRLEKQAGVPLLERVGRGVMLTATAGTSWTPGLGCSPTSRRSRPACTIGRTPWSATCVWSRSPQRCAAWWRRPSPTSSAAHPDLTIGLSEREPWDTIDLVATGQCEIGIVHSWGDVPLAIPDHLSRTSVASDEAEVIVHRSHRLAKRTRVTPRDLVDEDWIATPDGTICREWLDRMHDGTGTLAPDRASGDGVRLPPRAGAGRLGIALVPRLGRQPLGKDLVAVRVHPPCRPATSSRCTAAAWPSHRPSRPWSLASWRSSGPARSVSAAIHLVGGPSGLRDHHVTLDVIVVVFGHLMPGRSAAAPLGGTVSSPNPSPSPGGPQRRIFGSSGSCSFMASPHTHPRVSCPTPSKAWARRISGPTKSEVTYPCGPRRHRRPRDPRLRRGPWRPVTLHVVIGLETLESAAALGDR